MHRIVELILIVPGAHWRVFDLPYQAEQFAVYHQHPVTRWTHYVGTQGILVLLFALAGPHALALWVALTVWYLAIHPVVGAAAAAWAAALAALGHAVALPPVAALAGLATLAAALNVSHSVEPVPPPLTGRGFEPLAVYWSRATAAERARLLALNLIYLPLEIVSAPRLYPVHVLRALHAAGWLRVSDLAERR